MVVYRSVRLSNRVCCNSSLIRPLNRSTMPSVCGCRGCARRCSISMAVQTLSKACWQLGFPSFFCEEDGELRTVVGQKFDDPDRRSQLEPLLEVDHSFVGRVTVDVQNYSARDGVMCREICGAYPISSLDQAAHQMTGRKPRCLTRAIGILFFKNYGSRALTLLVAIHLIGRQCVRHARFSSQKQ